MSSSQEGKDEQSIGLFNIPENTMLHWKDITHFINKTTNDFDVGQLVCSKHFTLFDAISAIEIMDSRMDTGMAIKEEPAFDITKQLTAEQVVDIMDNLVIREIAWLSGHSISQTVFTCVYFHHLTELYESKTDDAVYSSLRIYILATMKCCYYIWTEMIQRNVYEEEDFTTNLFGLCFDNQILDISIINDLDTTILRLSNQQEQNSSVMKAILNRIESRKSYLLGLIYLSQNTIHLASSKYELTKLIQLLDHLDLSVGSSVKGAFDPNINRKLTSYAPPRPTRLESKEEAYMKFKQLAQRLLSVCSITDYPSVISLMNFFDAFGSAIPYADAFSRSKLNTLLHYNHRTVDNQNTPYLILKCVKETVRPPDDWLMPSSKNRTIHLENFMKAHQALNSFLKRISNAFLELFRIHCQNRPRQRRLLLKSVREWQAIEQEAAVIDALFQDIFSVKASPSYYSSWARFLKLMMIERILVLGFELELYSKHEYTMILWYTRIVLKDRLILLQRFTSPTDFVHTQLILTQATLSLTEALLKIMVMVGHTNQWNDRKPIFDDEKTRYLQRFKAFLRLPCPPYEFFVADMTSLDGDIPSMKDTVKEELLKAKNLFNQLLQVSPQETSTEMCFDHFKKNIKKIIRVCESNEIGLNYIKQNEDKLYLVFKYHPWYPIITRK